MGSGLLSPQGQTGARCTFSYACQRCLSTVQKGSGWKGLYSYIIYNCDNSKSCKKSFSNVESKMIQLNCKQSNTRGAYFAGPPLILQHLKGESQHSKMEDSTSQPVAMVAPSPFQFG